MSSHKMRLFSDVGAKMSMFNKRAKEHRESQMINPFSEWGGPGARRKMSREDPDYGRPVEGSKTAERGRLAQMQMIGDMVELCDMIYDCGIRSPDGRAAISFGDAFRLYSSINDKVVGLLMRGRKHKILDFEGEMLFQGRDDRTMIELLLPLNTIRHKYGMPERAGCGEVDHELLQQLAEQDRLLKQKQQRKQQRTRSVGVPPLPPVLPLPVRHQKSRSMDNSWPSAEEARAMIGAIGPEKDAEAPVASGDGTGPAGTDGEGAAPRARMPISELSHSGLVEDAGGEKVQQQPRCAGGSEGRQEATSNTGEAEGGQEASGVSGPEGEHEATCGACEESARQVSSSGTGREQAVQKPPSVSVESDRGQEPSAPASTVTPVPVMEIERPPPAEQSEGQRQLAVGDASDLERSPGVALTDSVPAPDQPLTPYQPPPPESEPEPEPEPEPETELAWAEADDPSPQPAMCSFEPAVAR